ncbi:hypothetical protein MHU86_18493 [Fragilaria crotonensis]|nr:hypothetical protein MHU86_18493 [Fragilaria crotonensis]
MRYSLPAIAVDEEELAQVQTKIIPTIVQKLGLSSSKLPVAVRHGPISMGGLGLMDLRTEGGIEMVYGNTEVGKLLLLQLQASQLESGVHMQLLAEPSTHISYLTPLWILSMHQFMSNHNISMDITNALTLPLRGPNDQYIMNSIRLKGYTTQQQTDINLIRLFLQVTTIADMVDCHEPS